MNFNRCSSRSVSHWNAKRYKPSRSRSLSLFFLSSYCGWSLFIAGVGQQSRQRKGFSIIRRRSYRLIRLEINRSPRPNRHNKRTDRYHDDRKTASYIGRRGREGKRPSMSPGESAKKSTRTATKTPADSRTPEIKLNESSLQSKFGYVWLGNTCRPRRAVQNENISLIQQYKTEN